MATPPLKTKTIAIVAMPGAQLLDVSGPLDVFAEANAQSGQAAYKLIIVASRPGPIRCSSGVHLLPDRVMGDSPGGDSSGGDSSGGDDIDTLLIAGAPNAALTHPDPAVIAWLQRVEPTTRRYGSVCAGAFLLAAAGLLDGRRITTHWAVVQPLAERYPSITIDEDAIHVRDGRLRTAAGVTAGLDLALALVEEDLGRGIALKVAGQLVMFFKRPGGQRQFSRQGEAAPVGRSALQEVQRWVAAHPDADHSIASLAKRMDVSPRHFARLFQSEVGLTPAAWVEASRIAAARRLLEEGHETPKQVAVHCGFADVDTLRRAFVRQVGVTPAEYRRRHATTAV